VAATAEGRVTGGGESNVASGVAVDRACPLCGGTLEGEQEWCLRCGAAARTRLAGAPNWKGPLMGMGAVAAVALGVLAAALVALTGDSGRGTASTAVTRTVTVPGTVTVTGGTLGSGAAGTGGTGTGTTSTGPGGVVNPGTPTTIKPGGSGSGTTGSGAGSGLSRAGRERVGGLSLPSEEALRRAGFLRRRRR
jgi:hypothetical protein